LCGFAASYEHLERRLMPQPDAPVLISLTENRNHVMLINRSDRAVRKLRLGFFYGSERSPSGRGEWICESLDPNSFWGNDSLVSSLAEESGPDTIVAVVDVEFEDGTVWSIDKP
jgi:hypothetical protein